MLPERLSQRALLAAPRRRRVSASRRSSRSTRKPKSSTNGSAARSSISDRRFTYEEAQQIIETGKRRLRRRGADAQPSGPADAQNTLQARSRRASSAKKPSSNSTPKANRWASISRSKRRPTSSSKSSCCWPTNSVAEFCGTSQSERPCRSAYDGLPRTRRSERGEARKVPDRSFCASATYSRPTRDAPWPRR